MPGSRNLQKAGRIFYAVWSYKWNNSDKFYHWDALLCVIGLAEGGYIPNFGSELDTEDECHERF